MMPGQTVSLCPTAMIKQPVSILNRDDCSQNSSKLSFSCRSFDNRLIGRTSLSSFCRCFDSFSNGQITQSCERMARLRCQKREAHIPVYIPLEMPMSHRPRITSAYLVIQLVSASVRRTTLCISELLMLGRSAEMP